MSSAAPQPPDVRPPRQILLDRSARVVTLALYGVLPTMVLAAFAWLLAGPRAALVVVLLAAGVAFALWRLRGLARDDGSHMRRQGLVRIDELPDRCGLCSAPLAGTWTSVNCKDCGDWYRVPADDLCPACRERIQSEVEEDLQRR